MAKGGESIPTMADSFIVVGDDSENLNGSSQNDAGQIEGHSLNQGGMNLKNKGEQDSSKPCNDSRPCQPTSDKDKDLGSIKLNKTSAQSQANSKTDGQTTPSSNKGNKNQEVQGSNQAQPSKKMPAQIEEKPKIVPPPPKRTEKFKSQHLPKLPKPSSCFHAFYLPLSNELLDRKTELIKIKSEIETDPETSLMSGQILPKKVTYYEVFVPQHIFGLNLQNLVKRRFKNFVAFQDAVLKADEGHLLPALPDSSIKYPRSRKYLLQSYLRKFYSLSTLVSDPSLSALHSELKSFLFDDVVS